MSSTGDEVQGRTSDLGHQHTKSLRVHLRECTRRSGCSSERGFRFARLVLGKVSLGDDEGRTSRARVAEVEIEARWTPTRVCRAQARTLRPLLSFLRVEADSLIAKKWKAAYRRRIFRCFANSRFTLTGEVHHAGSTIGHFAAASKRRSSCWRERTSPFPA